VNAPNGAGDRAAVPGSRPLVLLRQRGDPVAAVHLAPLPPEGEGVVSALCGVLLLPEEFEAVLPGHGAPCSWCVLHQARRYDPPPAGSAVDAAVGPDAGQFSYRAWGWPVTVHGDQVWLDASAEVVAMVVPGRLAGEATALLVRWRCSPAVLVHPSAAEHQVMLAGERFTETLPCPGGVHRIGGNLLLPPTPTRHGPLTWVHPPAPESLRRCREIDIVGALRAVRREPPSSPGPMHF
jgi:hypothetical protein